MESYQTLSLIGCILGILGTMAWFVFFGVLSGISDTNGNENDATMAGLFFAFILYIVAIIITFVVKTKVKAVGISLIVIGIITTAITNLWGIIALALLLPAGIVALRYREEKKVSS